MKSIVNELRGRYKNTTLNMSPSILTIILESTSRAQLFRDISIPLTSYIIKRNYFCWNETFCTHRAFLFNRFNSKAASTISNLVPLFCGEKYSKSMRVKHVLGFIPKNGWIWEYGKKFGYISSDGGDNGNGFGGTRSVHLTVDMRPAVFPMWKDKWIDMNDEIIGYIGVPKKDKPIDGIKTKINDVKKVRYKTGFCAGDTFIVDHILNYTLDMWNHKNLMGIPKWGSIKLNDQHSPLPLYSLNSIDKFLYKFLKNFLKEHQNTVIILLGDHGYGKSDRRYQAAEIERLSPALVILFPSLLLNENPSVEKMLLLNSQRLLVHEDIYQTYKGIMNWPQKYLSNGNGLNLLSQEVPFNRTCEQVNLGGTSCLCSISDGIRTKNFENRHYKMANIIIQQINKRGIYSIKDNGYTSCRKVTLNKIIRIFESKDKNRWCLIVIQSNIGPSIWEGSFVKNKLVHLIQLTKYRKYENCRDHNVDAEFCICKQFPDNTP
jgi:hypothetical protein